MCLTMFNVKRVQASSCLESNKKWMSGKVRTHPALHFAPSCTCTPLIELTSKFPSMRAHWNVVWPRQALLSKETFCFTSKVNAYETREGTERYQHLGPIGTLSRKPTPLEILPLIPKTESSLSPWGSRHPMTTSITALSHAIITAYLLISLPLGYLFFEEVGILSYSLLYS